jgi:hypothetical protein
MNNSLHCRPYDATADTRAQGRRARRARAALYAGDADHSRATGMPQPTVPPPCGRRWHGVAVPARRALATPRGAAGAGRAAARCSAGVTAVGVCASALHRTFRDDTQCVHGALATTGVRCGNPTCSLASRRRAAGGGRGSPPHPRVISASLLAAARDLVKPRRNDERRWYSDCTPGATRGPRSSHAVIRQRLAHAWARRGRVGAAWYFGQLYFRQLYFGQLSTSGSSEGRASRSGR